MLFHSSNDILGTDDWFAISCKWKSKLLEKYRIETIVQDAHAFCRRFNCQPSATKFDMPTFLASLLAFLFSAYQVNPDYVS
jgi:hypothetical protein